MEYRKYLQQILLTLGYIYINDFHNALNFYESLHFADDTCLLNIHNTISKTNELSEKDLKELPFWLTANKFEVNAT